MAGGILGIFVLCLLISLLLVEYVLYPICSLFVFGEFCLLPDPASTSETILFYTLVGVGVICSVIATVRYQRFL